MSLTTQHNTNNKVHNAKKRRKTNNNSNNHNQGMSNVIITPSIAAKANRRKKIVTSTSRRTLKRSQRGSALGSNKRPLRLVLRDKTNSNKNEIKQKKRKLNKDYAQSSRKPNGQHKILNLQSLHKIQIMQTYIRIELDQNQHWFVQKPQKVHHQQ